MNSIFSIIINHPITTHVNFKNFLRFRCEFKKNHLYSYYFNLLMSYTIELTEIPNDFLKIHIWLVKNYWKNRIKFLFICEWICLKQYNSVRFAWWIWTNLKYKKNKKNCISIWMSIYRWWKIMNFGIFSFFFFRKKNKLKN